MTTPKTPYKSICVHPHEGKEFSLLEKLGQVENLEALLAVFDDIESIEIICGDKTTIFPVSALKEIAAYQDLALPEESESLQTHR